MAALPRGHPLAAGDVPLRTGDFDGQDFVMYSPIEARYFHELLVSIFRTAGVTPVVTQYLSQIHSILALVDAGWGIALVPEAAARMRYAGVTFKPVRLPDPEPVQLNLVWRGDNDNPALGTLLRQL